MTFQKTISQSTISHKTTSQWRKVINAALIATTLITTPVFLVSASTAIGANEQQVILSEAELDQALAPIALYPDTLLTHILIASTYPIEVIEADRWLKNNSQLTPQQVESAAENKGWDASIQALLAFPKVIEKLSDDLTWMQKIGDAFLQDESRVLASIQTLRQKADQAGSLDNIDNVSVIKEQQVIIIEPAQPEIIYVPYYDTRVVYGRWHWARYPPVYWNNPHHYAAHYGNFYWGIGVQIRSGFYFSAFHWQKRHVVVTPYNRYRQVSSYGTSSRKVSYHSRKTVVSSGHAKRWNHQPAHRRGVAYSNKQVKQKYYGSRPTVHSTNTYKKSVNKSKVHNKNVATSNSHKTAGYRSSSVNKNNNNNHKKVVNKANVQQNKHNNSHSRRANVSSANVLKTNASGSNVSKNKQVKQYSTQQVKTERRSVENKPSKTQPKSYQRSQNKTSRQSTTRSSNHASQKSREQTAKVNRQNKTKQSTKQR